MQLIYALKDGKTVHISEVESGLKCGCVCPACGEPLVAKKGNMNVHHFAHQGGHNCEYGYETSLHLAAKEIISKAKKFVIPAVFFTLPDSPKETQRISEPKEIPVDDVKLEQRYGDIIPDIVIISGGKELFVEIFVTHRIDDIKLEKIKKANISTLEINLSEQNMSISEEELSEILLSDSHLKAWKHNSIRQKYQNLFHKASDRLKIVSRGKLRHVDNCPIKARIWKGKAYANLLDDCQQCDYCISIREENEILCSGRLGIATIQDFNKSLKDRIKERNDQINDTVRMLLAKRLCPRCGNELIQRQSQYGSFWGCSHYPRCQFVATIDPETNELKRKN